MAHLDDLIIYQQARANCRLVHQVTHNIRGYSDLISQMRRSSTSVTNCIAEGSRLTRLAFIDRLRRARGEVHEMQAQGHILSDVGQMDPEHELHDKLDHNARSISALITHLQQRG